MVFALDEVRKDKPNTIIVILLPFALRPGDCGLQSLERLVDHQMVRLVTCDGKTLGRYFSENVPVAARLEQEIGRWTVEARMSPMEELEGKLVRRVGQYKLDESSNIIRHLYDGGRAFGAIYELAVQHLRSFSTHDTGRICYDVRHSHWFRGPVEAALRDTGLLERSFPLDGEVNSDELRNVGHLLLPIVRTGSSLAKLVEPAVEAGKGLPRIWALLSTKGSPEKQGGRPTELVLRSGASVNASVEFSLKVEAGDQAEDLNFWQKAPIEPIGSFDEPFSEGLSSDSMWGMILEAGLVDETPVPLHRASIGYTPNFGRIAERNGPFIASKVEGLLEGKFGGRLPPSIGFLCPREQHAESVAKSLRELAGYDTIFVGRSLIQKYVDPADPGHDKAMANSDFDEIKGKLEIWKNLVHSVSPQERPQIILLDEFNLSFRTFDGLRKLASDFDLPVKCAVSLVSYLERPPCYDLPHYWLYHMGGTY